MEVIYLYETLNCRAFSSENQPVMNIPEAAATVYITELVEPN